MDIKTSFYMVFPHDALFTLSELRRIYAMRCQALEERSTTCDRTEANIERMEQHWRLFSKADSRFLEEPSESICADCSGLVIDELHWETSLKWHHCQCPNEFNNESGLPTPPPSPPRPRPPKNSGADGPVSMVSWLINRFYMETRDLWMPEYEEASCKQAALFCCDNASIFEGLVECFQIPSLLAKQDYAFEKPANVGNLSGEEFHM